MTKRKQRTECENKGASRIVFIVLLISLLSLAFHIDGGYALAGSPNVWHIETVDSEGDVGWHTSLALDSSNSPHISYFDNTNDDLKYAYYDGAWHIEIVDSEGDVGRDNSMALDSNDYAHISYRDWGPNLDLKYAYYDGTWHTETVDYGDNAGYYTSIALDSEDNPHISYYDYADLKYAYYDGTWHIESVDTWGGVYGTSIALDNSDNPHISFYNNDNLKYAYYDGTWHIETVDSVGDVGDDNSIVLDNNDNPHISYYDRTDYDLKYAYYDGVWHIETVDSEGVVGYNTCIALDSGDKPHISYYDGTNDDLKYAYYDGTWHTETVDTAGDVGTNTSIAMDSSDVPHISYRDATNSDLKYAHKLLFELSITTTTGGTTNPAAGTHTYLGGYSVEVTAIPNYCYELDHWELDGEDVGSANPYSVLMDDDHTLHAVFVRIDYDLTITTTTGGTTDPAPGIHIYPCDSSVEVSAIPNPWYLLEHWELDGDDVGSADPYLVLMDGDHTLHAVFDTTYCQVWPINLNFGTLTLGNYLDKSFAITNTDGETLTGSVSESCDHYSIVSGGGAYSLEAGDSVVVTVRFEPTSLGQHNCSIETGNDLCSDVFCTGVGQSPCQVSPTSLNFGTIMVGSYLDKSFTVTNIGEGSLSGTISESCDHYSIVSGEGSYVLATGEYLTVTVRFEPTSPGQHNCAIETGNDLCSDVYCAGVGRGEWYWKLAYEDYAPNGMVDIDQKQDGWLKFDTDQWSFCGPCAVANCFKWFDSKYNEGLGGGPGDGMDAFPLVRDYLDELPPIWTGWDDHSPENIDHPQTPWNMSIGPPPLTGQPFFPGPQVPGGGMPPWGELVERLAWYFDTDGIQTGYCNHTGTNILQMHQGVQDWLESEMFGDGSYLADTLCVAITARPTFAFVESLVEKSDNVILLLGFWYLAEAPAQQQSERFIRGDLSQNGVLGMEDILACWDEGPFPCDDAADANDDGVLDVGIEGADCQYISDYLFSGGPPPPPPYPDCGQDPSPDELDCGSFVACGQWRRVGGHYVTAAGVNSMEQRIAFSDPFFDAAELGLTEGRVGDGWLIYHPWGNHDPTVHNDEGNVSHDMYTAQESEGPAGRWHLVDYAVSSDPYYWTGNFFAQNVPEEFVALTQPWDGVSPIFTEIEYCIRVGPWDYRGDCNGDGELDIADVIWELNYLFKNGAPPPWPAGDVNCDGVEDLGDVIFKLNYLFKDGDFPRCCGP